MERVEVERGDTAGRLHHQVWVGGVGQGEHTGNSGTGLGVEIIWGGTIMIMIMIMIMIIL